MKYGTIVPLIGGMVLGNEKATRKKPSFILSYDAFSSNDSHCINRYPNSSIGIINDSNHLEKNIDFSEVDFVSSTCPCAGLSMLNRNSRGADAEQNEWMYKSSDFILENVKPKVLWGENAPGLYSRQGEPVVDKLYKIAEKYNYSFSVIKTDTRLHGVPQRRVRTFYFFWKSKTAPILDYYKRDMVNLEAYLKDIPKDSKYQNLYARNSSLKEDYYWQFFNLKGFTRKDAEGKTLLTFLDKKGLMGEYRDWLFSLDKSEEEDKKYKSECNSVRKFFRKKEQNLGVWDPTPYIPKENVNAVISKNMDRVVHPTEDRFLNHRENMWLMGLPHDFEVLDNNFYHYTQNVPVQTVADWTKEIMKFVKGKARMSDYKFIKQDNIKQVIDKKKFSTEKSLF